MAHSVVLPRRDPGQLVGASLAAGASAVYVRGVDPSTGGWFPSCPLHALTGVWCPACGMTRATHHVLNGELLTALRFNVLVVPVLLGLLAVAFVWARTPRAGPARSLSVPPGWVYLVIVSVAAFTIVRNIPALGVLRGIPA